MREWCWAGVGVHAGVQSGVYKRMGARVVSGFLVTGVLGFPILREYLGTLGRGTTVPLFRVQRGSLGLLALAVSVVPGCVVPGSIGDRSPQLVGSAVVMVWETCPAPLWRSECGFRVPPNVAVTMELGG